MSTDVSEEHVDSIFKVEERTGYQAKILFILFGLEDGGDSASNRNKYQESS
jgi:hypothetical protein